MPKLLLVEDNEMNRDMLSRRLIRKGYEVVLAEDGQQGVDMATTTVPDLILMDMDLPVIDGWEATRQIKARHPDARVIILTQYDDPDLRVDARKAGACGYILKENIADLRRMIIESPAATV